MTQIQVLKTEEEGSQAERERARQEQEQAEKRETEMARSSKLPPLRVKRVKRSSSRRIVLIGLAWLVIVALIRRVVWFTAHQTPLTRGIQAPLAGRITSGANATTTVQAPSGIPGKTWQTQNAENASISHHLDGVAWSGSQFVIVGYTDEFKAIILTSPDGRTWTAQNSGTSDPLDGVAWSGTQFVVVDYDGTILTSPDGRTWTAQNSGTSDLFAPNVAWLDTQFVIVGDNGAILTSPDGRTWTAQNSGTLNSLARVAWSGTRFVVVCDYGTILTSP